MHLPTEDASAVAAAGWRALGIDRRAAPLEAALEPTSVKADPAIDSLGDDVLSLCLAQARCGWTLAAAMQVCHAWRTVAAGEELWENAVTTRWRLATRRRSRSGGSASSVSRRHSGGAGGADGGGSTDSPVTQPSWELV